MLIDWSWLYPIVFWGMIALVAAAVYEELQKTGLFEDIEPFYWKVYNAAQTIIDKRDKAKEEANEQ